jgi:uncharacterized FlgJ-related protein
MKIVKIKQKDLERIINEQLVNPIQIGKYIYDKYKKLTSSEPKKNEVQGKLPFTDKNLAQELKKQGVMYPDVALAQSMLETGYFKSNIFLDNNNLFGMKHPRQRPTLSKGPNRGHASFNNWQDSVKDYKMWQEYNKLSNLSKDQYIAKLNRIYCIPPSCGSDNYAKKVQSLLSKAANLFLKGN